jgi:hypothetical protein
MAKPASAALFLRKRLRLGSFAFIDVSCGLLLRVIANDFAIVNEMLPSQPNLRKHLKWQTARHARFGLALRVKRGNAAKFQIQASHL